MSRVRVAQDAIEVLITDTSQARVAQDVIEVLQSWTVGATPSGSFGVAVAQRITEVLISDVAFNARVAQDVIEVLITDGPESGGTTGGGQVSYGFAF